MVKEKVQSAYRYTPEFHQLSHSSICVQLLSQPRQSTQCSWPHPIDPGIKGPHANTPSDLTTITMSTPHLESPSKLDVDVCIAQKHILMADNGPHVHPTQACGNLRKLLQPCPQTLTLLQYTVWNIEKLS